jgi:hypothetical protein
VGLEQLVTYLLWPAIGLVAWWARSPRPEPWWGWLAINLLAGPLMLVPLAWWFVTAPTRAAEKAAVLRSRAPQPTPAQPGGGGPGPVTRAERRRRRRRLP